MGSYQTLYDFSSLYLFNQLKVQDAPFYDTDIVSFASCDKSVLFVCCFLLLLFSIVF